MATHAILLQNNVAAQKVGSLNRSALSGSDIDNGWIFNLLTQNTVSGQTEVWDAIQPFTGSLIGLWMAAAPEVVVTTSGNSKFRGIDPDPRNFYTAASTVFDAFRPQKGDIITLTAEALDSGTPKAYAIAALNTFKWTWADNVGASSGVVSVLRYISTTYLSIGSGSAIGTTRVPAFKFEVLDN